MTQKEALRHTLNYAQSPFAGNIVRMKAARAFCIISWLTDMNWHPEAKDIEQRILATPYLKEAFVALMNNAVDGLRLDSASSLMNWLFGWSLRPNEWKATRGEALVEELWNLVTTQS